MGLYNKVYITTIPTIAPHFPQPRIYGVNSHSRVHAMLIVLTQTEKPARTHFHLTSQLRNTSSLTSPTREPRHIPRRSTTRTAHGMPPKTTPKPVALCDRSLVASAPSSYSAFQHLPLLLKQVPDFLLHSTAAAHPGSPTNARLQCRNSTMLIRVLFDT
jgi:hypothetical protein